MEKLPNLEKTLHPSYENSNYSPEYYINKVALAQYNIPKNAVTLFTKKKSINSKLILSNDVLCILIVQGALKLKRKLEVKKNTLTHTLKTNLTLQKVELRSTLPR